jgi:hypothetical protein
MFILTACAMASSDNSFQGDTFQRRKVGPKHLLIDADDVGTCDADVRHAGAECGWTFASSPEAMV